MRLSRIVAVVVACALAGVAFADQATTPAQALLSTIRGTALTSTNGQLANTPVRRRDARYGRVLTTQTTDESGGFAFRSLEPGSYVVEIMSPDESSALAASEIVNVNAGEVASTVVRLPFRMPPFAGVLGGNITPASATAVLAQAAASGVLLIAAPATAAPTCQTQMF